MNVRATVASGVALCIIGLTAADAVAQESIPRTAPRTAEETVDPRLKREVVVGVLQAVDRKRHTVTVAPNTGQALQSQQAGPDGPSKQGAVVLRISPKTQIAGTGADLGKDRQDDRDSGQKGIPGQGKPDQDKPDQGKPDQDKPDQGKPDQDKPDQGKPDQGKPDQGKPGLGKPDQGKPGLGKPDQNDQRIAELMSLLEVGQLVRVVHTQHRPEEGSIQGKPGQGKPGQGKPGQGKPGQGEPGQGELGQLRPKADRVTETAAEEVSPVAHGVALEIRVLRDGSPRRGR